MTKEKQIFTVQQELQNYSKEALAAMSDEEHARLGLKFFVGDATEGKINLAYTYKNKCGGYDFARGSRGLKGLFDVSLPVDVLLGNFHPFDNYISVNKFKVDSFAISKKNVSQIDEVYIDIDLLHDISKKVKDALESGDVKEATRLKELAEHRDEYLQELCILLEEAFLKQEIKTPSMYMVSGRGLSIHYKYAEPLAADEENIALHAALYVHMLEIFDIFFHTPGSVWTERLLDVDKRVKDITRVCRIPGTLNRKAKSHARILSFGAWYAFDELAEAFGTDRATLLEKKSEKQPKCTRKQKKLVSNCASNGLQMDAEISEYISRKAQFPFDDYKHKKRANFLIDCFDILYVKKTWIEGAHRERFILLYFNYYQFLHGRLEAYQKVLELNRGMQEPLSYVQINYAVLHVMDYPNGYLKFSNNKIFSSDWLDISEELAEQCGFLKWSNQRKQGQKNNIRAMERDKLIAELYLTKGYGIDTIAKFVHEHYSCGRTTVYDALKRLGIQNKKGHAELFKTIDFEKAKRYARKTQEQDAPEKKEHKRSDFASTNFLALYSFFSEDKKEGIKEAGPFFKRELYNVTASRLFRIYMASRTRDDETKRELKQALKRGANVLVLGVAGTGKTYTINEYIETLSKEEQEKTAYLAFTGQAALNLPHGRTIHSFLGLKCEVYVDNPCGEVPLLTKLEEINRIIIDEVGQIRVDYFTQMIQLIQKAEEVFNKRIQLILLGDFSQIQPVVTKEDKPLLDYYYPGVYAFHSKEWNNLNLERFVLFDSKRQKEESFKEELERYMFGDDSLIPIYNKILDKVEDKEAIYICPTNEKVNEINQRFVSEFTNKKLFKGTVLSGKPVEYKTKFLNLELAVGMKVMAVTNKGKLRNGMRGTIVKINRKTVKVEFEISKDVTEVLTVESTELECRGGKIKQLPLTYGYAITADKSQGMTFDSVNIIPGFFSAGQLYTALSRCTTKEGIHLLGTLKKKELIVDLEALLNCLPEEALHQLEEMQLEQNVSATVA